MAQHSIPLVPRYPVGAASKFGYVLSAEFASRLVVDADGTEHDGAALASTLAYLDARHTLRLSVWDVFGDALLRDVATAKSVAARPFSMSVLNRSDIVRRQMQYADYDTGVLLRPYCPSLLDVVISACITVAVSR
jgi:hypothetical protein